MDPNDMNLPDRRGQSAFPPETPVGMAYVPVQQFSSVFEPDVALEHGTVFPELVKPWLGGQAFSAPQPYHEMMEPTPYRGTGRPDGMGRSDQNE